jgi:hypothetical protein
MKRKLALLMAVMMIVLAGCQSVDGVELGKVLKNVFSLTSSEGTSQLTLTIIPDDKAALTEDEKRIMELFGTTKINITEQKLQNARTLSMKGELVYAKGSIPFQLNMADENFYIQIAGADKPIVFNSSKPKEESNPLFAGAEEQLKQLSDSMQKLNGAFGGFFGAVLPNSSSLSVTNANEIVNNERLSLKNIQVVVKGSELVSLVKGLIDNILSNEQALKELLEQLYDTLVPVIKEAQKQLDPEVMKNDPTGGLIMNYLDNKTLMIEFLKTTIVTFLKKTAAEYDESVKVMQEAPDSPLKDLLSEQQSIKLNWFVDSDLNVRKTNTEINLFLTDPETGERTGIKVMETSQLWNHNRPVTAAELPAPNGYTEVESFTRPSQVLGALDPNSQLYKLLKDDLHITRKKISMVMDDASGPNSTKPYIREGVTLVPARFVVERLDADVDWDADNRQVTIVDGLKGTRITMTIGSQTATVNGLVKRLEVAPELVNGTTFVPVRFIAQDAMGATVNWDDDTKTVTISRD